MRYAKPPKKRAKQARPMFANEDGSRMTAADIDQVAIGALCRNGADPAFIFAFEKVGLLVSELNWQNLSAEDLAAWECAIDDYERQHPDKPPLPTPRRIRLMDLGHAGN